MKDGFIIYKSLYDPISELSREEKGHLLEAIFVYQKSGEVLNDLNPLVNMAFKFFKNQFDIDEKKYEAKCLKNKENAKKRWDANAYERIRTDAMDADKDKDKDKDKDNGNDIESRKSDFYKSCTQYSDKYSNSMIQDFFEYWTEHGEKDNKMRFEKEKSFGIGRRLSTWKKNENKFNNNTTTDSQIRTTKDGRKIYNVI